MSELKPCPFCGSEVQDDERGEKYPKKSPMGGWIIHCECCGASLSQFRKSGKDEISWNTRPIEDELRLRIAELEAERRWIPVSERLPDNWESVLTIDISKSTRDMVTAFYNPETSLWSTHFSCDLWVTHWMPLPESPIVYGKVCEE